MKRYFLFCAVLLLLTQPLLAHDMWLQKSGEGFDIIYGHQGEFDPYEPERVKEVVGYTENGWPVQLDIEKKKDACRAVPDEAFCAIGALLDNQYWLKTTKGWKNQRDKKGLEIIQQGRSYKYTKNIVKWCDNLAKPLGQRFEIVPLQDPTGLKQGDRLPVKVFFEGRPALGAKVAETSSNEQSHDVKPVQVEDPFMVTIGPPGLQLISAKFELPVRKEQIVWFAASLTFSTTR